MDGLLLDFAKFIGKITGPLEGPIYRRKSENDGISGKKYFEKIRRFGPVKGSDELNIRNDR